MENCETEFVVHPAFQNAGRSSGIEIWRIEQFEPVQQEKSTFGKFYKGDAYLVLNSKSRNNSFEYDLHFWLGKECAADEKGSAAIRTVELADSLSGVTVQHREVQSHESKLFLSYFKSGIRILNGGVESGFKKVEAVHQRRLFQAKGRRTFRIEQVELSPSSLNQGDTFVLEDGQHIYVWFGPKSNIVKRTGAVQLARSLRDEEKAGRAHIHIIENDWETNDAFFKALGFKPRLINPPDTKDDDEIVRSLDQEILLYQLSQDSTDGSFEITEISERPLRQDLLQSDNCYALDSGFTGIFVWTGKQCPIEFKKKVWKGVNDYLDARNIGDNVQVSRVVDGGESPLFKQYFDTWTEKEETQGLGDTHTVGSGVAAQSDAEFDASSLHGPAHGAGSGQVPTAEQFMPDDASGRVQVWKVEHNKLKPVPDEAYGVFFGEDCYLILYTGVKDGKEAHIIYFWQGLNCSVDERAASALHAVQLNEELGGNALQMRVVMNKEPEHFLKMFKGKIVLFRGGRVDGFSNLHDYDDFDPNKIVMFQIKGSNPETTRAIEVEPRAASLNSNNVFILDCKAQTFVWIGKNSIEQEGEMAKEMIEVISYITPDKAEPTIIEEGSENNRFWSELGGKEEYYTGPRQKDRRRIPSRLFHCSISSGRFSVEEFCDFHQEDLREEDVMILDTYDDIAVWIGAKARDADKKNALKLAYDYLLSDPTGRTPDNTLIVVIRQGYEPPQFTGHFSPWDLNLWNEGKSFDDILKEVGEENVGITLIDEEAEKYTRTYPIHVLQRKIPPEGVDVVTKELYLADEDFVATFGLSKENYSKFPQWKKIELKKKHGLF